jgi:hypothetical protein
MPSDTRQLIDDYVLSTSKGMKKNLVDLLNRYLVILNKRVLLNIMFDM